MNLKLRGSAVPVRNRPPYGRRQHQRSDLVVGSDIGQSEEKEYCVGPGRPPKEYQFKPGASGNPKGAKRKTSLAPDLKAILERELNEKVRLRQGEREQIITKGAAGISKLVNQFAEGDRHARRDLITLAGALGVDLTAGRPEVIEQALAPPVTADDQALVDDYVRRRWRELNDAENTSELGGSGSDDSRDNDEEEAAK
jgi:hypothetical protein